MMMTLCEYNYFMNDIYQDDVGISKRMIMTIDVD